MNEQAEPSLLGSEVFLFPTQTTSHMKKWEIARGTPSRAGPSEQRQGGGHKAETKPAKAQAAP